MRQGGDQTTALLTSHPTAARTSGSPRRDAPLEPPSCPRTHLHGHLAGHLVALGDPQRVDAAVQQRLRLLQQRARDDLHAGRGGAVGGRSATAAAGPACSTFRRHAPRRGRG